LNVNSITICAFTTDETDAPLFRLLVEPNERNGLRATCRLMLDKITTVKFEPGLCPKPLSITGCVGLREH
jgi:mRNA-degrading endonuclease toxin of MazEF toxin-antitoxin module